jgi:DNA-binding protein YbaB
MVGRVQTEWQAHIETMLDEYRRLRGRIAELRSALANLTETVCSADGAVTVTVDHGGRLLSLDLDQAFVDGDRAGQLSARIVATAGLAAQRVARRARTLIGESLPDRYAGVLTGETDVAELLPADPHDPSPGGPR